MRHLGGRARRAKCRWRSLTSARLTALYRQLEVTGRHDGSGGLLARTVRYIHTIVGKALSAAVDAEPPLLVRSPAAKASPPTAKQARPPDVHPWTVEQLGAFLSWSAGSSHSITPGGCWRSLACAAASCSRCAGGMWTGSPR
jgi:hypothetical protein